MSPYLSALRVAIHVAIRPITAKATAPAGTHHGHGEGHGLIGLGGRPQSSVSKTRQATESPEARITMAAA